MKSAHEILLNDKIERFEEEREQKRRAQIIAASHASLWPWLLGVVVWPLIGVVIILLGRPGILRPAGGVMLIFFFVSLGQLIATCKKREKALLSAIESKSPELYQKPKE